MELENILYEIRDGTSCPTLGRLEVHNALIPGIRGDISATVQCAQEDDQIRAVIVAGVGEEILVDGTDIHEIHGRDYLKMLLGTAPAALENLEDLYKPVICAISGCVPEDGCELAMACDVRVTTRRSRLKRPEVGLSIIPSAGGAQGLSRLVRLGKVRGLIYAGKIITAEEIEVIGLVNQVIEDDRDALMTAVEEVAHQTMTKGPAAITMAKMAIDLDYETDINTGLTTKRLAQTIAFNTEDRKEGTAALLGKCPTQLKGR